MSAFVISDQEVYAPHADAPLPGELPVAYIVRCGHQPGAQQVYEDLLNASIIDRWNVHARQEAALKQHKHCHCDPEVGCELTPALGAWDVAVFYRVEWEWGFDGVRERRMPAVEVVAVYDSCTWEDLTHRASESALREIAETLEDRL